MNEPKKTIYLVDDDITNLTIGTNVLSKQYNVLTLNSGVKLLNALKRKIPDLILLDVDMPEMNGFEVMAEINKAGYSYVPVIFLTAKSDGESEMEGLSLGAIDYINKPFAPLLLLKRIEVHLLVASQKLEIIDQNQELKLFNYNLQHMVEKKTEEVLELQNAILIALSELVERRDSVSGSHINRVKDYLSVLIKSLKEQGLYADQIVHWDVELILQSSQLHDVGKISVSDAILLKPDKLTPEEFDEIKLHTVFCDTVFEKIKKNTSSHEFLGQAQIMASTHHEKWDGSGYPAGLKGEEIPLQGRLMAIADVYDALVSTRPYKQAFSHEDALTIIKKDSGKHFDPNLVELLDKVADDFRRISAMLLEP